MRCISSRLIKRITQPVIFVVGFVVAESSYADKAELEGLSLVELLNLPVESATRTETHLLTAPSSVTLFHRQQFKAMGVDYLHELTQFVPGFQVFRSGEAGDEYYHSVRGRRTGSSSREVLVLVDGVRQNRSFDHAVAVPMLPLVNIEKVEFIRGPGSALYGSNAFTGVIAVTTRSHVNEVNVGVGADHSGQVNVAALLNKQVANWSVDFKLSAFDDSGQSYRAPDSFTGELTDITDPYGGVSAELSAETESTRFMAGAHRRTMDNFYLLQVNAEGINRTQNDHFFAQADHRWYRDSLELRAVGEISKARYLTRTILAPEGALVAVSSPPSTEPLAGGGDQIETVISGALHSDWEVSRGTSIQSGVEWRRSEFDALKVRNNYDLAALVAEDYPIRYYGDIEHFTLIYPSQHRDLYAAYAQAQSELDDRWRITVGGRYDSYSANGSAFSPRVALIRQLGSNQSLKLLYGGAFRAPSMNEVAPENNTIVIGNPDLKPEKVRTLELVWVSNWEQGVASLSLFENRYLDAISQAGEAGSGRGFVNSSEELRSQGADFEYSHQITERFQLRATGARIWDHLDSEYRQAATFGSLTSHYQLQRWGVNTGWVYTGKRSQLTSEGTHLILPAYHWLTFKLSYDFYAKVSAKQSVWLQVKNAADKAYLTPAQAEDVDFGMPNRGRELSLGVRLAF